MRGLVVDSALRGQAVLLYSELRKIKRETECLLVVELITAMTQIGKNNYHNKKTNPEPENLEP